MGKPSLRPEDIVDPSADWIKADPDRNGWYEVWARYGWGGDHPREQVTTMLWRDGKWDRSDSYARTAEVVAHLEPMRLPDTAHAQLDEQGTVRMAEWVVRSTMREYRDALRAELRHPTDSGKAETRRKLERCIMGHRFDVLSMSVVDEGELIRKEREKAILDAILDVYRAPAPWFDWNRMAVSTEPVKLRPCDLHDQQVRDALKGGPATVKELETRTGLKSSTVVSSLHRLEAFGRAKKSRLPANRRWYIWALV